MTNTKTLYTPLAMLIMVVLLMSSVTAALIYRAKAEFWQSLPLSDRVISECERVDAEAHSDDVVSLLLSAGYTSVPGDGEFLYSPMCNVEMHEDGTVVVWDVDFTPAFVYEAK